MNAHTSLAAIEAPQRKPDGMREYEARCAIRELIESYGIGGASQLVNEYLKDEARRTRQ
jgi:hypothetical protein